MQYDDKILTARYMAEAIWNNPNIDRKTAWKAIHQLYRSLKKDADFMRDSLILTPRLFASILLSRDLTERDYTVMKSKNYIRFIQLINGIKL